MIRTVLIEDEQLARDRLRQLLSAFEDIKIVGEAADGEQAIEKILETQPDLIFLDVQMPGCNGLEVVRSLPSPHPRIIFCTAFDQYAVDAFEVHAVDYLLKPVSRVRLAKAIDRVRRSAPAELEASLEKVVRTTLLAPSRFLAKRGSKFHVIPQQNVLYFASEEGLTKLCTENEYYWMEPTMNELEQHLDPSTFFRISRASIVNLNAVREVFPIAGGYGEVLLKSGVRLDVSRRRLKELMQKLQGET